jgi:phage FluMu protein Com
MAVEFRCMSCSKLLRTPDESAGKKAKCPQCGAILDVPRESPSATGRSVGDVDFRPTADSTTEDRTVNPYAAPTNPYAAPTTSTASVQATVAKGELQHTLLDFDELLRKSWVFFKENVGEIALLGLVLVGINIALGVVGQVASAIANASQDIIAIVLVTGLTSLANIAVQSFLGLGAAIYTLNLARTQTAKIGDVFAGGPFFLVGLLVTIVTVLCYFLACMVCLIPTFASFPAEEPAITIPLAIVGFIVGLLFFSVLWFRFLIAFYFLVDRGGGVFESLSESARYMNGNKLAVFLVTLVVGVLGMIPVCASCGLAYILYIPFFNMLGTIVYLSVTGQPYREPQI